MLFQARKQGTDRKVCPFFIWVFLLVITPSVVYAIILRDGDIIFQTSRSTQSLAIQKATHSQYSHMGIILFVNGKPYVYEAIKTVQYTPLTKWIQRGVGHHYVVKRLQNADSILTPPAMAKLRRVAEQYRGKPYDLTFAWSDERIYCSELIWKIYEQSIGIHLGELQHLRDFDLTDPMVQNKIKERYGKQLPLDEPVIAPSAIFKSDQLVTVEAH